VENLLLPDLVRRLCWEPPEQVSPESVAERLVLGLARPWQVDLAASPLSVALTAVEETVSETATKDLAADPILDEAPFDGTATEDLVPTDRVAPVAEQGPANPPAARTVRPPAVD
jgi:hypothetical protein